MTRPFSTGVTVTVSQGDNDVQIGTVRYEEAAEVHVYRYPGDGAIIVEIDVPHGQLVRTYVNEGAPDGPE